MLFVLGYRWDSVDDHDWQCQRFKRGRGGRCRNQTVDRFTPVCRVHLDDETRVLAAVVEAAYKAGLVAGRERTRSAVALQRGWDEWVKGSSLEVPAPLPVDPECVEGGSVPVGEESVQEVLFG